MKNNSMGCEAKSPTGKKIPRENYFSQDALFLFSFDSEGKIIHHSLFFPIPDLPGGLKGLGLQFFQDLQLHFEGQ